MRKNFLLSLISCVVAGWLFTFSAHAQVKDIPKLMQAGEDAGAISNAYLTPLFRGFGATLNSGWYNTAEVHKTARFDLTFSLNTVIVPSNDKTYDASALSYKTVQLQKGTNPISPTLAGEETPGATFVLYKSSTDHSDSITFNSLKGAKAGFVPAPVAHLAVGLIKGTEISVRYIPTITISGVSLGLYGFGVKHDVKQWIPVISELPFDWSAQFGYTKFNASYDIDGESDGARYHDQELLLVTDAYTFNTIVSKKIALLTLYGGIGYQGSSTNIKVNGTYQIKHFNSSGVKENTDITNPVDVTTVGTRTPTLSAGFRLKFVVFTIHGGVTVSQYSSILGGLGVSVDFL